LNILHVANHTHRYNGNVHAAIDLACAQADAGHTVTMCSAGGSFDDILRAHGVALELLPELATKAGAPRAVLRLRQIIRERRAAIVHAHMVTTVHNAFERSAIIMGLGDRVIAVSQSVGGAMEARGVPRGRLRVVLNGTLGTARYEMGTTPEPEALAHPAVLYVGGLHPRKGIADLLKGFSAAREQREDLNLYLVGEGPCEEEYRGLVAEADRHAIHFCGSRRDPRSFMLGADAFVLASHADPAPLVLSEAREAGLAVIATEVDGIPELLEGGAAGLLIPPKSPDRIAQALLTVFADEQSLAAHRARGQINLRRLSLARVADETLVVYRQVARGLDQPLAAPAHEEHP
jgi:glycosyltransferase involved in cell wall biosynthesis